ncbi:MAG: hypothetical protein H6510_10450 [Acidobacteria bacterium]|nr:hypothetical protein [Acidobacteriota bacterium]MCB9398229.1 hypothetical protein [Acidobacteriota bacterium]
MQRVTREGMVADLIDGSDWSLMVLGPNQKSLDAQFLNESSRLPLHLSFCLQQNPATSRAQVPFASIPFFSLCKGLFLPLAGLAPDRIAQFFGFSFAQSKTERQTLIQDFLGRDLGLSRRQKIACVLGDPFWGGRVGLKRDSLMGLLASMQFTTRSQQLDQLRRVGDVAFLFAENATPIKSEPALTAGEVLETLFHLPKVGKARKLAILRSLFRRMGKLEAYFTIKLILRRAGIEHRYEGDTTASILGHLFDCDPQAVRHAMALTDVFQVVELLEAHGEEGLKTVRLKPLVPFRPALAGGVTDDLTQFPVWVERKYDGIRLLLHKSTDAWGGVLCGAYSRTRSDFIEQIPGLERTLHMLPSSQVILDGELYGTVLTEDGLRPATVYEVFSSIQGGAGRPVQLKYAAFDLLYLNGLDLTGKSLRDRRQFLSQLVSAPHLQTLPIPIALAQGQMAQNKEDVNRYYHHFRAQGYEGIVVKALDGVYLMDQRDPNWRKRKPEITLDLVLLGAVYAVTTQAQKGMFGSYIIGARDERGGFVDIGDVAGVDRHRDMDIQSLIMREGLATGRRLERASASGVRPGFELRPFIVVTVKFEGIVRDQTTQKLSLRDPKLVTIRSDKAASECDSVREMEEMMLRGRLG